jgi:nicotinate-nucleotide adenylyltransferase
MPPERKKHTLAVEDMAVRLGELLLPEKPFPLRLAALLHDITKFRSYEEQLSLAEHYGILLSPEDIAAKKTLHARTGARFARDMYGNLVTEEIFHAIDRHTVGAPGMTTFEKIVFVADLIEETRTYPFCVKMRNSFFTDVEKCDRRELISRLDKILLSSFENTIASLTQKGEPISPDTLLAYNDLKQKVLDI